MTSDTNPPSGPPQGETYGDAVKRMLAAAGRTQAQFAAAQGMTTTMVSRALDNKFSTHSPTDGFHAAVLAFLDLDKDSEQARHLEPLYEAARNPGGMNYWQDETRRWQEKTSRLEAERSRLRLAVDEYSLRVEEATQDRDAAKGTLGELQEQLALLSNEMERVTHEAGVLAQEHSALRAHTKQQKNKHEHQLDQAAAYAKEQESERQAAEEQARALGREVVVLQRQVRFLQEEQAGQQPVARVATDTSYQEATARARARNADTERPLLRPDVRAWERTEKTVLSRPPSTPPTPPDWAVLPGRAAQAPPPPDSPPSAPSSAVSPPSDPPSVLSPPKATTSRSLRRQGHLYCLAASTAGLSLTALTAVGFFTVASLTTRQPPNGTGPAAAWRNLGAALSFWQWDWTRTWHSAVLLLALIAFFGFWHLLYQKAHRFMFATVWTHSDSARLPTRLVFRLSRLTYPGYGRIDPQKTMLLYGMVTAVVLSMTAGLAPLGQRIDTILNFSAPATTTPSAGPSASPLPPRPVRDPVADIGDQPVNTAPIMKLPACDRNKFEFHFELDPQEATFTAALEPHWTLTVRGDADAPAPTCRLDAGRSVLALEVRISHPDPFSDSEETAGAVVWKSSWCTPGHTGPRWLELGWPRPVTVGFSWNGRTATAPGCTSTKAVPSGTYVASIVGVDSRWASFSLKQ